jgi:hypothetical protein
MLTSFATTGTAYAYKVSKVIGLNIGTLNCWSLISCYTINKIYGIVKLDIETLISMTTKPGIIIITGTQRERVF